MINNVVHVDVKTHFMYILPVTPSTFYPFCPRPGEAGSRCNQDHGQTSSTDPAAQPSEYACDGAGHSCTCVINDLYIYSFTIDCHSVTWSQHDLIQVHLLLLPCGTHAGVQELPSTLLSLRAIGLIQHQTASLFKTSEITNLKLFFSLGEIK